MHGGQGRCKASPSQATSGNDLYWVMHELQTVLAFCGSASFQLRPEPLAVMTWSGRSLDLAHVASSQESTSFSGRN